MLDIPDDTSAVDDVAEGTTLLHSGAILEMPEKQPLTADQIDQTGTSTEVLCKAGRVGSLTQR